MRDALSRYFEIGMVAGDLVNATARLQSAAQPGAVLIGDATRRATSRAIAYELAGEQVLKGNSIWIASEYIAQSCPYTDW